MKNTYAKEQRMHALYLYTTCMLHLFDHANFFIESLFHYMLELNREKAEKSISDIYFPHR